MQITAIKIKNFRGLREVEMPLSQTTVMIGENNSGKTSVLECISLALGRRWGQRGTGFSEYDLTIDNDSAPSDSSQAMGHDSDVESTTLESGSDSSEVGEEMREASIELIFTEHTSDEWPEEITSGLFGILRVDPNTTINSIALRVSYKFNQLENNYVPGWAFIDINGDPIAAREARRAVNTQQFFKYVPVFFLSALRDASQEFSSRSQYWGRLLKAVEIPPDEHRELDEAIEELNTKLLAADPRVAETVEHLKEIQAVVANGAAEDVSIRALPMKVWELLARSEIVIKGETGSPWLPLLRHGQGVKSLSVIYLLIAYVERLLVETYSKYSEPIITLDEPEVHLHPQAIRALWSQINEMPGQKIIATHSPYFMQNVPIRDIRLLRRRANNVQVNFVPEKVSVVLPNNDALIDLVEKSTNSLCYNQTTGLLSTRKPVKDDICQKIIICYTATEVNEHHSTIRDFQVRSLALLENKDLRNLEDWSRRTRGEVFFSRLWILCEGQTEVFFLTALFDALQLSLDTQSVSLIDFQNNGSARGFACLARTFNFPWILLTDGDKHGQNTRNSLKNAGFDSCEIESRVVILPDNVDLERYIVDSTWRDMVFAVAGDLNTNLTNEIDDLEIATILRKNKPIWARLLGDRIRLAPPSENDLPDAFARLHTFIKEHNLNYGAADKS